MSLSVAQPTPTDCNSNAIPDSLDIKLGFALDANQNGIIDDCDPDEAVSLRARTGDRWWRFADSKDSIYFGVAYTDDPNVTIRYTVPADGAAVLLMVRDSTSTWTHGILVNRVQLNGPYTINWNRELNGVRLGPGTYTLRLVENGKQLERRLGWRTK